VTVVAYSGLTVDVAREHGAAFIVKGVRSVRDYESEREQAEVNRRLAGIDTVLLMAEPGLEAVSSSTVRSLRSFGRDVSEFLPK
jgi:pantetheine-phosphate adenylyltransferase